MPLVSASLDVFLLTATISIFSYVFIISRRTVQRNPEARFHTLLNTFVLLHTLFILYTLILKAPPNLFTRLHVPLTMSSEAIRVILLKHAGRDSIPGQTVTLPKHLETLLTRLSSFDARNIYVRYFAISYAPRATPELTTFSCFFRHRFGQVVLQDCEYCHTYYEYALYSLPRPLLGYIRETAIVGFLTILGSRKERWRTYAIGAIACAAVGEEYWVSTVQIKIPSDGMNVVMVRKP